MKLSEIRSAIRKVKGNPSIVVELTAGVPLTLMLQKTPLLDELGRAFNSERTAETGLTFDEDTGVISSLDGDTFIASGEVELAETDEFDDESNVVADEDDLL